MKVIIKENINLAELKENRWNGCRHDTMLLLQNYYDENAIFEVKKMSPMDNYIITIEDKDWIVNPKIFEIIEEDKKIEKIECKTIGDMVEVPMTIDLVDKINEIIDVINKGDK